MPYGKCGAYSEGSDNDAFPLLFLLIVTIIYYHIINNPQTESLKQLPLYSVTQFCELIGPSWVVVLMMLIGLTIIWGPTRMCYPRWLTYMPGDGWKAEIDLFAMLALDSEYKNHGGSVVVWFVCQVYCIGKYFWSYERDWLNPCSPLHRILLFIQAFYQKREPHSFKITSIIQVEFFLFSASSRWNVCGMVFWAWWNQTSPFGWETDCLRDQHQRLMGWAL